MKEERHNVKGFPIQDDPRPKGARLSIVVAVCIMRGYDSIIDLFTHGKTLLALDVNTG